MHRLIFRLTAIPLTLIIALSLHLHALETNENSEGACIKVMEACKAAGYNKTLLTEKKSLSKNCIQPLLEGQKVQDIIIDPKDIEACKAKKLEIKLKK